MSCNDLKHVLTPRRTSLPGSVLRAHTSASSSVLSDFSAEHDVRHRLGLLHAREHARIFRACLHIDGMSRALKGALSCRGYMDR